ncbi:PA0069 family radical SAM protein [Roseimaritima sediminicola]|uniref:PA0069 family radical SAM protein n=1 Tax=Roseimaritima sediminicola TaxID=2662066 RepID=UPI0012982E1A|nr:PA0069 family radical SAM protein [Roseimaritima sediminicola]
MPRHGSELDPPNRFASTHFERDWDQVQWDQEYRHSVQRREPQYLEDASESIVSENRSPDIPFRYSLNPYRGCLHGCSYCYARPTHEYLGLNAGLDFESRIVVKHRAAELFRRFLARPGWSGEPITFSGVTDCYQPAERRFQLTRQCLEVALACHQPISIITKNALVLRDLDILAPLAAQNLVHVYLSITTLDAALARQMEPRTSTPEARLRAIGELAAAGVPVGVMMAPLIPHLTDSEIPSLLGAAAEAGASAAGYVLLRLPLSVEPVFVEWLERERPNQAAAVLERIRDAREGRLNSAKFGERLRGKGERAEQIRNLFQLFQTRHGLDRRLAPHDRTPFQPPPPPSGQMQLF